MITIKKYSNRRLYDTAQSRYITLDELADIIRAGQDIRVVDAKSGEDLTQGVLAQIILESRGAARLFSTQLMMQLIRMEDDALGEFFGQYLTSALQIYQRIRRTTRGYYNPYNPMRQLGYGQGGYPQQQGGPMSQFMSALYGGWPGRGQQQPQQPYPPQHQQPPFPPPGAPDMAEFEHQGYPPPEAFEQQGHYPQPQHAPYPPYDQAYPQQPMPQQPMPQADSAPQPPAPQQAAPSPEVAQMRAELEELKMLIRQTAMGATPPASEDS